VAQRLHALGASEAALDLLERALSSSAPVMEIYRLLVPVLTRLGRYDDAVEASDILRTLSSVEGAKLAA
jgi:hypothetical protein